MKTKSFISFTSVLEPYSQNFNWKRGGEKFGLGSYFGEYLRTIFRSSSGIFLYAVLMYSPLIVTVPMLEWHTPSHFLMNNSKYATRMPRGTFFGRIKLSKTWSDIALVLLTTEKVEFYSEHNTWLSNLFWSGSLSQKDLLEGSGWFHRYSSFSPSSGQRRTPSLSNSWSS